VRVGVVPRPQDSVFEHLDHAQNQQCDYCQRDGGAVVPESDTRTDRREYPDHGRRGNPNHVMSAREYHTGAEKTDTRHNLPEDARRIATAGGRAETNEDVGAEADENGGPDIERLATQLPLESDNETAQD